MFRSITRLLRRGGLDPRQLFLPLGKEPETPSRSPRSPAPVRRRRSPREEDAAAAQRLTAHHAELNASRFRGMLTPIRIEVSRRLRSRLGYYRLATSRSPGLIVISRRHLRRHGWAEAIDTLLHEMVHQWQDEQHLPVDHGAGFRAKAREVGCLPRARRVVR